jgi:hypothetical protein
MKFLFFFVSLQVEIKTICHEIVYLFENKPLRYDFGAFSFVCIIFLSADISLFGAFSLWIPRV